MEDYHQLFHPGTPLAPHVASPLKPGIAVDTTGDGRADTLAPVEVGRWASKRVQAEAFEVDEDRPGLLGFGVGSDDGQGGTVADTAQALRDLEARVASTPSAQDAVILDRAEALAAASASVPDAAGPGFMDAPPTHAERLGRRVATWEELRDELRQAHSHFGPTDRLHSHDPAAYTDSHVAWPLGARSAVPLPAAVPERKAEQDKGWRAWSRNNRELQASVQESIRQSEAAEARYRQHARGLARG